MNITNHPRFENACLKAAERGACVSHHGEAGEGFDVVTPPLSDPNPLGSFYLVKMVNGYNVKSCTNLRTGEPCKAHTFGNPCYHAAAVVLHCREAGARFEARLRAVAANQ